MNAYYEIVDKFKELLEADPDINTVIKSDHFETNKKNIYPLAKINVVNAVPSPSTLTFQIAVAALSLRNKSNTVTTDKWQGNDNEDDNLNTMLFVLHRLYLQLDKMGGEFELESVDPFEPVIQSGQNTVDGWMGVFNVIVTVQEVGAC